MHKLQINFRTLQKNSENRRDISERHEALGGIESFMNLKNSMWQILNLYPFIIWKYIDVVNVKINICLSAYSVQSCSLHLRENCEHILPANGLFLPFSCRLPELREGCSARRPCVLLIVLRAASRQMPGSRSRLAKRPALRDRNVFCLLLPREGPAAGGCSGRRACSSLGGCAARRCRTN